MKLRTVFRVIAACSFVLLGLFSAHMIGYRWSIYQSHLKNTLWLDGFKQALTAMDQLSAERGYTNTALGQGNSLMEGERSALRHVRSGTNMALEALIPALKSLPTMQRYVAVRHIRLLQQQLDANRNTIDTLLAKDKRHRSRDDLAASIQGAIQLVPYMDNTVIILANNIARNNATFLDAVQAIRTATTLRDMAGQLGSVMIPAIIKEQAFNDKEQLQYQQTKQRIHDMHLKLNQQLAMENLLPQALFLEQKKRMENNYFRQAIRSIDSLAAIGKTSGKYQVSSGQFTDAYMSSMTSIQQLRRVLLAHVQDIARAQKQHAYVMLLLHIGFCVVALMWLAIALHTIHRRMIMPIMEASVLLAQPAGVLYKRTPHPMYKRRDEASAMLLTLYALRTSQGWICTLPPGDTPG